MSRYVIVIPQKQLTNRGTWSVGPKHLAGRARADSLRPPEPAPEKRGDGRGHERTHDQRVEQQPEADGGPYLAENSQIAGYEGGHGGGEHTPGSGPHRAGH